MLANGVPHAGCSPHSRRPPSRSQALAPPLAHKNFIRQSPNTYMLLLIRSPGWLTSLCCSRKLLCIQEYKHILFEMDYFPDSAEATPLIDFTICIPVSDFTTLTASKYIRTHIIYKFGIYDTTTIDNGQPFKSIALHKLYAM